MTTPVIDPEVAAALAENRAVVALESTIFSHLGLPSPHNAEALQRCTSAVRSAGAVPAVTAVLDGIARVGLSEAELLQVLGPARKTASRDLGVAVAQGWEVGATTVSAALTLAAASGVGVFATGGIGGVHRGADTSFDISADLGALARHPVITVCAGPKYFLDLAATLEVLETAGVPVLGLACDELPAFYSPTSGIAVPVRVEGEAEVADIATAHWALGGGGVLTTVPIPAAAAVDRGELDRLLDQALATAEREGVTGAAITPMLLAETARSSGDRSIAANLALAEQNAAVAGRIAVALTGSGPGRP